MMRSKRQFDAAPELVVLGNGVRIVVQYAQIATGYTLPNEHPHAFYSDWLIRIIHTDTKDQFRQVARL